MLLRWIKGKVWSGDANLKRARGKLNKLTDHDDDDLSALFLISLSLNLTLNLFSCGILSNDIFKFKDFVCFTFCALRTSSSVISPEKSNKRLFVRFTRGVLN